MIYLRSSFSLCILIGLCCTSCSDDPKLVEKREKQKAEIMRLKGELDLIEEKLKTIPPDVTKDLEEAEKLSEKQNVEVAALENEIATMAEKKRSLQREFDAYRAKYQLK